MSLFRNRYRIESTRLVGWDYSSKAFYFVTICTSGRARLFGNVVDGCMVLSDHGQIAESCWRGLPNHYDGVVLDCFQVMPDHVHGIIRLVGCEARGWRGAVDVPKSTVDPTPVGVGVGYGGHGDGGGDGVETGLKPVSTKTKTTNQCVAMGAIPEVVTNSIRYHTVSEIVRGFKTFTARRVNEARGTPGESVWQKGFHDRIVRGRRELWSTRRYIRNNPRGWLESDIPGGLPP